MRILHHMIFRYAGLFLPVILFHSLNLKGQHTFVKTYGGTIRDYGVSVVKTYDGGYAFCGGTYTSALPSAHIRLLIGKTDSSGNLLWMKNYTTNELNYSSRIVQTPDSGLVIAGTSQPYNSNYQQDVFIIKVNEQGDSLWGQTIGSSGTQSEYAQDLMVTRDGSLVTVGTSAPAVLNYLYMTKTSPNGTARIKRQVAGSWFGVTGRSVVEALDGNYLFAASQSDPTKYMVLVKTDTAGNTLWAKRWTKPNSTTAPMPECLVQMPDSTMLLATTINYNPNNDISDTWVVKFNSIGDTLKSWTFPQMRANTIFPHSDGGFTINGQTPGFNPEGRMFRVSADGQSIFWDKTYSFYQPLNLRDAIPMADGGYMMVGSGSPTASETKVVLIRTDSLGNTTTPTAIGGFQSATELLAFPNPTEGKLVLQVGNQNVETIRILNVLGMEVKRLDNPVAAEQIELSLEELPKGLYRIQVQGKEFRKSRVVVLR